MRLVKEIEFQARTENEAFRKVKDKLGSDGIILSLQSVRSSSIIPFLGKKILMVRAGILEEEKTQKAPPASNPELEKKQIEVFRALLEYKRDMENRNEKKDVPESLVSQVEDRVEFSGEQKEHPRKVDSVTPVELPQNPVNESCISAEVKELIDKDLCSDCAEALWEEYSKLGKCQSSFWEWLKTKSGQFCFTPGDDLMLSALGGQRIMILGPTGVGKTTTIAKIAAIALQEGRDVALFTSDNYRVSAVEQIRTFARVLNIPLEVVNTGEELPGLLKKYSRDTLILMDTAGHGFTEKDRIAQIEDIWHHFEADAVHMAVSATARMKDVKVSIDTIGKVVPISRIILTKVDETLGLGSLLSVPMTSGLPLSFVTTGQNVPRDINYADSDFLAGCIIPGGAGA